MRPLEFAGQGPAFGELPSMDWGGWCGCGVAIALLAASIPAQPPGSPSRDYGRIARSVSKENLTQDLARIAGFGSRLAGSDGERKTLEFAEARLRELGFQNIRREAFTITVPQPESVAALDLGSEVPTTLYPLWPNLIRTSTSDLSGRLMYLGAGRPSDLKGKVLKGALAVIDFDSEVRWQTLFRLGVKAVIYLEPDFATRFQFEDKFSAAPHDAPRFWLPAKAASRVLPAAAEERVAGLRCRQTWVVKETYNLLADLPGADPGAKHERIVLAAYADSMSVVPGLSPGADASSGLSALLELARYFKENPPRRPLTFVVQSGHGMALKGAREFVQRRIETDRQSLLCALTLDLSTGNSGLGSFARGWFYEVRPEATDEVRALSRQLRAYAERIAPHLGVSDPRSLLLDAVNDSDGRPWKNDVPGRFAADCEPFLQARYNALTFRTVDDARSRFDTPFDTLEHVDVQSLFRQTQALACLLNHVANDTTDIDAWNRDRLPLRTSQPQRMSLVGGFAELSGRVVEFDPLKSFLPDTSVPDSIALNVHDHKTQMGVRPTMIEATVGREARYRFVGASPVTARFRTLQSMTRLEAYRIDPLSGSVTAAPNVGQSGLSSFPNWFSLRTARREAPLVVFDCEAIDLYDLADPHDLQPLVLPQVLDPVADAPPKSYGAYVAWHDPRLNSEAEDSLVLFVAPGSRWKLLLYSKTGELRVLLSNATSSKPHGRGFATEDGDHSASLLLSPSLAAARDFWTLNQSRIETFAKYRMISPSVVALQQQAKGSIDLAAAAFADRDPQSGDRHASQAWGLSLRVHPVVQGVANNVVSGVVYYLILLLPFSFFAERLLFGSRVFARQILLSTAIFVAAFLALRFLHPAFEIVSNPTMIFVAFVMGSLSVLVGSFVIAKFETSLRVDRLARLGVRQLDIGRIGVGLIAFQLGVENLRRRRLRTTLTTLVLVVVTFVGLSLTSVVSELKVFDIPTGKPASYAGIVVRKPNLDPLPDSASRILQQHFAGRSSVARRVWYYGADLSDTNTFRFSRGAQAWEARAFMGLDPLEPLRPSLASALAPGGRWFEEGERDAVILPQSAAEKLGISPENLAGAQVSCSGERFRVIGLFDEKRIKALMDLDGDPPLPADFTLSKQLHDQTGAHADALRSYLRLDPSSVALLPARSALELGGEIRSLAVGFGAEDQVPSELENLMPRLRLNLFAAVPTDRGLEARYFSVQQGSRASGVALVLIQALIALLFVVNTMVAGVYERTREIGIFSAIGLAPNHVALLYFAESLVYGVLGSVLGYFCAQGLGRFLIATDAIPGLYVNFSATSSVLASLMVAGVVLGSSLYPARIARKIAAPALDDEFQLPPPDSDEWTVPLPIRISAEEVDALLAHLKRWLLAYEDFTIGDIVTAEVRGADKPLAPLGSQVWLAPYDLGVSQSIEIRAEPSEVEGVFGIEVAIGRLSGEPANWVRTNRRFLEALRRQFLIWRASD